MKKIFIAASLFFVLQASAQDAAIATREFWQNNPDAKTVKEELAKGFDFKNIQSVATDPVALAVSSDAPNDAIKLILDQPNIDFKRTIHEGRIYLHSAAYKGNAEITDYLINKGSDIYFLDANGHTALTYTAFNGHLTIPVLEAFLNNGVDVNEKYETKDGANVLLLAVGYDKDLSITNYLVSKGVSINSTDNQGNTAFDHAAKIGDITILKALLQKGVKYNESALFMAAQGTYRSANKIDVYHYLVDDLKIDPLITNGSGQNVLHFVVRKQNQADVITYFFNKGVDINKADHQGDTPFIGAAGVKSPETVALLIPKVKNINAVNAKGESALLNAVKNSSADVVDLLIKNGADVHVVDKEGNNLAFYLVDAYRAAGGGRGGRQGSPEGGQQRATNVAGTQALPKDDFSDKANVLQAAGLNLAAPLKEGNTLYHIAIAKNDVQLLKKLAPLGIDVNAKNNEGLTVLHKAAMLAKNDAILRYLVSTGADKAGKTSFEETAFDLANENEFLREEKISVDFLK